jgi:hypothetical protein
VDLNAFAVAIARFRLTVAALKACGLASLEKAPAFTFHLAVGDSLIHGPDPDVLPGMANRSAFMPFTYTTEDGPLLLSMLEEGTYDVVVGNPPYITVKDKALNQIYRSKYAKVCKGTYALTVPFIVLFFALAKKSKPWGWVGQITSNSFMKREFGSKLIEDFLSHVDLQLIADTSGAHIPGHGTPTVILIGRNRQPVGGSVRAALGIRREAKNPNDPAKGLVWRSIVEHIDEPGWDDSWITIADLDRKLLANHPWSLSGGGAVDLKQRIGAQARRLTDVIDVIGFASITGEDDAFLFDGASIRRLRPEASRLMIIGDAVRDYCIAGGPEALFPYDRWFSVRTEVEIPRITKILWPTRRYLQVRRRFSVPVETIKGFQWFEYREFYVSRLRTPLSIVFAEVATHNHFVLDRGGNLFKQTAPVIKLPNTATEGTHLALLGVLNSSTVCFWLKQVCYDKGAGGIAEGVKAEAWERFYAFNGANVAGLPLPPVLPLERGQELEEMSRELTSCAPPAIAAIDVPTAAALAAAHEADKRISAQMIAVQEELDWEVYRLYGLIDEDLTYSGGDLPDLMLGERAFEIVLARAVQVGEETAWFTRHGSRPITEIPSHWPAQYQDLVRRRIDRIASNPSIRLLEKPEYKRRWMQEPWERLQERALREWLLDRLEDRRLWFDPQGRPLPRSVAQLADEVNHDVDVVSVLALWEGRPDVPVTQSLVRLLADEAVPFLAAYRYKESGLRKREAWEQTWRLQRREDAGEDVSPIPVPPKYTSADYRKNSYWQARGKLDVPKERFVLYPDVSRETDPTPLLGWAGWDHAQQSLALSLIIGDREKDGWADDRLVPLVAGLAELQPWVDQWHSEVDPDYGVSLAAFCREQLTARAAQVGKTLDELARWRSAPATRGRRARVLE